MTCLLSQLLKSFNTCNNGKIVSLKMSDFFLIVILEDTENYSFLDVPKNTDYVQTENSFVHFLFISSDYKQFLVITKQF